ncbi:MAG: phage tail protein, partial [Planctomycetes bacterium]|nr:phage tail protein [Planctomycetota bacterium]
MATGIATVKFNERHLRQIREQLNGVKGAMPKVMTRALNKTIMSARTQAAREIAGKIKVKVGAARKAMDLQRATYSRWRADLGIGG